MRIGILQTGHAPDQLLGVVGDYPGMFERLLDGHGFSFETYPVLDGSFPAGPEAADGWLITGSRHGAYDDLPWIPRLEDLIRDIAASGRPLLGICFGHQLVAQALGGKVEKYQGGWAVGPTRYDFGDAQLVLNAWHQDQVVALPPGAQVIASNAFCKNAAMVIGDNILTLQPHPEYDAETIEGLMTYRAAKVPPALIAEARTRLDTPTDSAAFAERMVAFLLKGGK